MKKSELSALWKRLIPELPGFDFRDQLLFMRPIDHTLKGIFLDSSIDPRAFYVELFVQPLFIPERHFVFSFGWRIGGQSWNADAPDLLTKLSTALHREAVPFLSKIKSPIDAAEAAMSLNKPGDPNIRRVIAYSFARGGQTEKAIAALNDFLADMPPVIRIDWLAEDKQRAEALRDELRLDPAAAQRRLENREAETRKNLGLEGYG